MTSVLPLTRQRERQARVQVQTEQLLTLRHLLLRLQWAVRAVQAQATLQLQLLKARPAADPPLRLLLLLQRPPLELVLALPRTQRMSQRLQHQSRLCRLSFCHLLYPVIWPLLLCTGRLRRSVLLQLLRSLLQQPLHRPPLRLLQLVVEAQRRWLLGQPAALRRCNRRKS